MQTPRRPERGATLAIVAATTFVLTLLVVGLLKVSLFLGGSQETRDIVDAGALAVGQNIFSIKVQARDPDEMEFNDVADSENKFGLTNINRVWAKAMLATINVTAMEAQGTATVSARSNAMRLVAAATRLNNRLSDELNDPDNLRGFFNNITSKNQSNVLGKNSQVTANSKGDWSTALVNRGAESGMTISPDQLPAPFDFKLLKVASTANSVQQLSGYSPMKFLNLNFVLVPFKTSEKVHLISASEFEANKIDKRPLLASIIKPIPNAFSIEGSFVSQDVNGLKSVSHVLVNPQRTFKTRIPNGFIRLNFADNQAELFVNGIPVLKRTYGFMPEVQTSPPIPVGAGTSTVISSVGNEYLPPTLFKAIFALPSADHQKTLDALLQRIREIKPDYSQGELTALLQLPMVPGIQEYVIFATDGGEKILASPLPNAGSIHPLLNEFKRADGSEIVIARELSPNAPNSARQILTGSGCTPGPVITTVTGEHRWKPGSGFGGCLGELTIQRTTRVLATGLCTGV